MYLGIISNWLKVVYFLAIIINVNDSKIYCINIRNCSNSFIDTKLSSTFQEMLRYLDTLVLNVPNWNLHMYLPTPIQDV